jgi:hypothetical protein
LLSEILRGFGRDPAKLRQEGKIFRRISPKSSPAIWAAEVDSFAFMIGENIRIHFHVSHDGTDSICRLRMLWSGHSVLAVVDAPTFFGGISSNGEGKEDHRKTHEPQASILPGIFEHLFGTSWQSIVLSDHNTSPYCSDSLPFRQVTSQQLQST